MQTIKSTRRKRYSSRVAESSSRYHRIKHNPVIMTAQKAYDHLGDYHSKEKEYFIAITLDGANRAIDTHIVSIGTLNQSLVHPREVFINAIRDKAAAIIIAHNHPSGQLFPSRADKQITTRLKDAGKLIGIDIVDHLILTQGGFYSFSDEGEL
ncbi:MAG: DNA repair protein RadC [Campylobacterota bacterium]|nr:DNA repair protein RadC [Campylobacterota bacterium]